MTSEEREELKTMQSSIDEHVTSAEDETFFRRLIELERKDALMSRPKFSVGQDGNCNGEFATGTGCGACPKCRREMNDIAARFWAKE